MCIYPIICIAIIAYRYVAKETAGLCCSSPADPATAAALCWDMCSVDSIQQSGSSITTPLTAILPLVTMDTPPQQPRAPGLGLNTALLSLHTRHETARLVRTSWSIFRSASALTSDSAHSRAGNEGSRRFHNHGEGLF